MLGELTAGVREVAPDGVLGDPTTADAAAGSTLVEQLSTDLLSAVAHWADEPAAWL